MRLFRLPNVFTAIADTAMAFAVANVVSVNAAAFALIVLATNAAIFGGLSAPVDRYQGRLGWFVAVVAAYCWGRILLRSGSAETLVSARAHDHQRAS